MVSVIFMLGPKISWLSNKTNIHLNPSNTSFENLPDQFGNYYYPIKITNAIVSFQQTLDSGNSDELWDHVNDSEANDGVYHIESNGRTL